MKDVREIINSVDAMITDADNFYFIRDSYKVEGKGWISYSIILDKKSGKYAAWKTGCGVSTPQQIFVPVDFSECREDYNSTELKYHNIFKDIPRFEKWYSYPMTLIRDVYPKFESVYQFKDIPGYLQNL